MMSSAFFTASASAEATFTVPSSSTSMATPVASTMPLMVLPPGPMMSRIWSGLTLTVVMRGAYLLSSGRTVGSVSSILPRMWRRPSRACSSACVEDRAREAGDLDVHLDGRDAAGRAADLEVHVAEVVLVAEDVGEDGVLARPP